MPDISVIIPTYNREHVITRAIDSVLAQSYPAKEIIVVDDGSDDRTATLINDNYPQVVYLKQENRGVSAARNSGIKAARSEWLALLDSDDEWLPDKLQKQISVLTEQPEYRISHSNEIWIRNGIRVNQMKKHQKYGGHIFQHCLPLCAMSPSSVVIHHSVFEEVGPFDESLPVCEDYDMWLRMAALYPVLYLDEPLLVKYGGHADQLSRQYWGMDRFRIKSIDKVLSLNRLNTADRLAAVQTLLDKIHIYLQGAKKHNNRLCVAEFEQLLDKYSPQLQNRQHPDITTI